jgi:hypothetical protein
MEDGLKRVRRGSIWTRIRGRVDVVDLKVSRLSGSLVGGRLMAAG